jgi:chromosome segregation ATPase
MLEYSYYAAALALAGTALTAWLSYRASYKAAQINAAAAQVNASAASLDIQLKGWQAYCGELVRGMDALREQYSILQQDSDRHAARARTCETELEGAQRRIAVLERRLGIEGAS